MDGFGGEDDDEVYSEVGISIKVSLKNPSLITVKNKAMFRASVWIRG